MAGRATRKERDGKQDTCRGVGYRAAAGRRGEEEGMDSQEFEQLQYANMLLTKAEIYIRPPSAWTRGAYARDKYARVVPPTSPRAVCWDAVGALVSATALTMEYTAPKDRPQWRQALRIALRELARAAEPETTINNLEQAALIAARYNDTHGRCAVLQLMRQASQAIYAQLYALTS
jgi:hypothetical protein